MTDRTSARILVDVLRQRGELTDPRLEAAFSAVPRHLFLPDTPLEQAYSDISVSLRHDLTGETISAAMMPSMMAYVLDQLKLSEGCNVLEIGTGSGYGAALLQQMVGSSGKVTTLEIEREIADTAENNLLAARIADVLVVNVDGAEGYAPRAAYDRIVSAVGVWDMPPAWVRQLRPNGRIVTPVALDGLQVTAAFTLQPDGTLYSRNIMPSAFIYIRGSAAGPAVRKRVGSTALTLISDEVHKIDAAAMHLLLSEDYEYSHLSAPLNSADYWYGFLPYIMLNETEDELFALYDVLAGQQAYGIEGEGFALLTPGSACFVPYYCLGSVHNYAGADAFLRIEEYLKAWEHAGRPGINRLRLRFFPKEHGMPAITGGRLFDRHNHYLHVWMDEADGDTP